MIRPGFILAALASTAGLVCISFGDRQERGTPHAPPGLTALDGAILEHSIERSPRDQPARRVNAPAGPELGELVDADGATITTIMAGHPGPVFAPPLRLDVVYWASTNPSNP